MIAAYWMFFPVTINLPYGPPVPRPARAGPHALVRGVRVEDRLELRFQRLPYLFTALKISATTSVVGAIIGELPASIQGGLGGAILNFNQYYATSPRACGR